MTARQPQQPKATDQSRHEKCFEAGANAARANQSFSRCPHAHGSDSEKWWREGYFAEMARQKRRMREG
jgi:hypothetical protein